MICVVSVSLSISSGVGQIQWHDRAWFGDDYDCLHVMNLALEFFLLIDHPHENLKMETLLFAD